VTRCVQTFQLSWIIWTDMKSLVTDRTGRFAPLKAAMLAGLLAPAVWLLYRTAIGDLGGLPLKELLHRTGDWTVRFLVLTLALTPLQRFSGWPKVTLVRRMAGVGTFCYGLSHFLFYVANSNFKLGFVASEIALRIYLTIGFVALLGLSALAATSTDTALRRLGPRWKQLHRLVYGIAVLALTHYFLQSKIDVSQAVLYSGFFMVLMVYRLAIRQRIEFSPRNLAAVAIAGSLLTAGLEFLWYWLATGVDPWRIAEANLMLTYGLRPAVIVLISGLAMALVPVAAGWLPGARPVRRAKPA
jgi:sulfoxide reductase heme-binding subunit YedZ